MDIFFSEKGDIKLPPEEMEIRDLEAAPYSDQIRIGVRFVLSPFQQKPNIDLKITNPENQVVATLSVVEIMDTRMTFAMHLKQPEPIYGEYKVSMRLYYTDLTELEKEGEDEEPIPSNNFLEDNSKTIQIKSVSFSLPKNSN